MVSKHLPKMLQVEFLTPTCELKLSGGNFNGSSVKTSHHKIRLDSTNRYLVQFLTIRKKSNYYRNLISDDAHDSKKLWQVCTALYYMNLAFEILGLLFFLKSAWMSSCSHLLSLSSIPYLTVMSLLLSKKAIVSSVI